MIERDPEETAEHAENAKHSYLCGLGDLRGFCLSACGKKGPPLPPLVKLPVPPADLAAARRGDTVDLSFTVPAVNTDGTRPANVASADVYAITAAPTVPPLSDANLLKYGTKVGSVEVKAPRDPNLTADADDPSDEVDPPEGAGLDQGARAALQEPLTDEMLDDRDGAARQERAASRRAVAGTTARCSARRRRAGAHLRRVRDVDARPQGAAVQTRHRAAGAAAAAAVGRERSPTTKRRSRVTWPPSAPPTAAGSDELLPSRPIGLRRGRPSSTTSTTRAPTVRRSN